MQEHLEQPDELKPCPFCGNALPHLFMFDNGDDFGIECGSCPAQIVLQGTRTQATAVWNRRS